MVYEYLLDLRAYYKNKNGLPIFVGETITCWGEDEYDALVRQIDNHRRKNRSLGENIYYRLSRTRPTGRSLEYRPRRSVPFFDTNARSYLKGLITRFMVRFLVSDTILEIDEYKEQFDNYIEEYGEEFEEDIIKKIIEQYNLQRDRISSGEVKPLSMNYDLNYSNIYNDCIIEHYILDSHQLITRLVV